MCAVRPLLILLSSLLGVHLATASPEAWIRAIQEVDTEGKNNIEAAHAWQQLIQQQDSDCIPLLQGMQNASVLGQNWLRAAVETLAEQQFRAQTWDGSAFASFLRDTSQAPTARLLAFELLLKYAPQQAAELQPTLLLDPVPELREYEVAAKIRTGDEQLESAQEQAAIATYQSAIEAARNVNQIDTLATKLRELKQPVDVARLLGMISQWHCIGPFTNVERKGFGQVFPPESELNLEQTYPGKTEPVRWQLHQSRDEYGMIDFNAILGMLKEVTGYAYTEIEVSEAGAAELRLGCKNAWKVWFNDELLFERDEYHRGMKLDQYKLPIQLQAGVNRILIKCCQNEQTETWTSEWRFQMRLCDPTGAAIPFTHP